MKKTMLSLAMISAAIIVLLRACSNGNDIVEARFAVVTRADVHQVIPITGRMRYTEEEYVCAQLPGVAERICVREGERVESDSALVRIEVPYLDEALSAFASEQDALYRYSQNISDIPVSLRVIRADRPCTIRQILIEDGEAVTAGMPLMRVTSHEQQIVSAVSPVDAERITPGMWAWIVANGETLCMATVESVGDQSADLQTGVAAHEIILIPEKQIDLPENACVDVDIYLAGSDDVLSIPLEAITERDTVWWVHDGRCTEIPASIVLRDEMRAWVQLPEGMRIAIGEFKNGQRVREVEE
nr:hypothetical protein [Clostridia bacterium]